MKPSVKKLKPVQNDISRGERTSSGNSQEPSPNMQSRNFISGGCETPGHIVHLSPNDALIDRFIIIKRLGHGRLGGVYLAKDTLRSIEVALKVIEVGPFRNDDASLLLNHELNIHQQITNHRHILRIFDIHPVPWGGINLLLMSMEYADGGTFRQWLEDYKDDLQTRRTTGLQYFKVVGQAVGTTHDCGVVHLDLKPENFLFVNGVLKISDFGASLSKQQLNQKEMFNSQGPFFIGTNKYMSPEHFLAPHPRNLGQQADIYSLGVILFELLHPDSQTPFIGTYDQLERIHSSAEAPKFYGIDEGLASIVSACLNKNPEDRYQSVWDLLEDIEYGYCRNQAVRFKADSEQDRSEQIDEILQTATLNFLQKKFNEAFKDSERVLSIDAGNLKAMQLREELQRRFDQAEQIYQILERLIQEQCDLNELIRLLHEAVNIYPNHPAGHVIQTRIAIKASEYKNLMQQGRAALRAEHWESALELFEKAYQLNSQTRNLNPVIQMLRRLVAWRGQIDQSLRNENLRKACVFAKLVDHQVAEMNNKIRALKYDS